MRMLELRPYAEGMGRGIRRIARGAESSLHPLLIPKPRDTVEVIVLTSDRGLCGAFNSNILKGAARHIEGLKEQGVKV